MQCPTGPTGKCGDNMRKRKLADDLSRVQAARSRAVSLDDEDFPPVADGRNAKPTAFTEQKCLKSAQAYLVMFKVHCIV